MFQKQLKRILMSRQFKRLVITAVRHYAESTKTQVDDALANTLEIALFPPTNG